jgi:hypothetical protein
MINRNLPATPRGAFRNFSAQGRKSARGFSIPQMLAYSVASSLLLAISTATMLSSIRNNNNMELYQRAEERWSRISSLIQSEASEASMIKYGINFACMGSIVGGGGATIFTLEIPHIRDDGQSAPPHSISYSQTGSGSSAELRRCGSGYSADGKLRFTDTNNTFSTVGMRTELAISNASTDSFTFTLNIYTPSNQLIFSRSATASVGVELSKICNSTETVCVN